MKRIRTLLNLSGSWVAAAYDSGSVKWKMDGDKIATDDKGNPVLLLADGSERSVQGDTVSRLNGEIKDYRIRAEKAEQTVEAFKDIDPAKAREALDKIGKIDTKALIDAGEVDKVRQEIGASFQKEIAERDARLSATEQRVNSLLVEREFGRSEFIANRVAVPREMFEATFGRNFKVEDGKVVPYDASGNKLYSRKNHGEVAGVDEAFEMLVENYSHKDQILKAPETGGSGGSGGGNRGGGRVIRRAEFDGMSPGEQAGVAAAMGKGEVKIVD